MDQLYTALAAAARNTQYQLTGAMMYTNAGFVLDSKTYEHEVEPEPEAE